MLQNRQAQPLFSESTSVLDKLLSLDQLRNLYHAAARSDGFHQNLLSELEISSCLNETDLARIPRTGPLLVVANHPFGMLEGLLLGTILPRVRQDYKIMTNQLLSCMPELESHCIFVDPFQNKESTTSNGKALRESLRWLRDGHMLVVFPAGEVSHWTMRNRAVLDPNWNDTAARLIRKTRSPALPMYFTGNNSIPFQLLGMVHPRLRTARLPHELFNKRGKTVEVRVGSVIPFDRIAGMPDDAEATRYLRGRTYLLGNRGGAGLRRTKARQALEPIAPPIPKNALLADLRGLGPEQQLADSPEFSVYLADAPRIPNVLLELGRQREITFRQVSEGTGKARDLDRFDAYYGHLILWSKTAQEIVGAYRVGDTDRIVAGHGAAGLYTSTLFHYDAAFFREIGPSLELGRSFVRPEYQKKYAPLLLLWKGLGRLLARNPQTPTLCGAVSISNDYNPMSRCVMARFLEEYRADQRLAKLVRPTRPFSQQRKLKIDSLDTHGFIRNLDCLSDVVADMESDGKSIPILLKQYLKLGGKLLGFNVDPQFSNTLDGLVQRTDSYL